MDRIARELGIDPLELRLTNAYRDGDMRAHRKIVEGAALVEVIQRAAQLVGHELPAPYREMTSTNRQEGLAV
jgi:CO/xanthine dehydrogenase Mo-binding subunit